MSIPILSLPAEVWLPIFLIAVHVDVGEPGTIVSPIQALRLSHVCRFWRAICLETKLIWSYLLVNEKPIWDLFLQRAREVGLQGQAKLDIAAPRRGYPLFLFRVLHAQLFDPEPAFTSASEWTLPSDGYAQLERLILSPFGWAWKISRPVVFSGAWTRLQCLEMRQISVDLPSLHEGLLSAADSLRILKLDRCYYPQWDHRDLEPLLSTMTGLETLLLRVNQAIGGDCIIEEPFDQVLGLHRLRSLSIIHHDKKSLTNLLSSMWTTATLSVCCAGMSLGDIKRKGSTDILPSDISHLTVFSRVRAVSIVVYSTHRLTARAFVDEEMTETIITLEPVIRFARMGEMFPELQHLSFEGGFDALPPLLGVFLAPPYEGVVCGALKALTVSLQRETNMDEMRIWETINDLVQWCQTRKRIGAPLRNLNFGIPPNLVPHQLLDHLLDQLRPTVQNLTFFNVWQVEY